MAIWAIALCAIIAPFHTAGQVVLQQWDSPTPFGGAAFFPNGSQYVTVSGPNVSIWASAAQQLVTSFLAPPNCGACVAVDPENASAVAVCCLDGVHAFATTGQPLRFYATPGAAQIASYNPNDPNELAVAFGTAVQLFAKDTAAAKLATPLTSPTPFSAVTYARATPAVVLTASGTSVVTWDRAAGTPVATVPIPSSSGTQALVATPSASDLMLAYFLNGSWALCSISTGNVVNFGYNGPPAGADFHPSGAEFTLLTTSGQQTLYALNGTSRLAYTPNPMLPRAVLYNPTNGSVFLVQYQLRTLLWVDTSVPTLPPAPAPTPSPAPSPVPAQAPTPVPTSPTAPQAQPPSPAPSVPASLNATTEPSPPAVSAPVIAGAAAGGVVVIAGCGFAVWKLIAKGVCCGASALMRKQQELAAAAREEEMRRDVAEIQRQLTAAHDPEFDSLESIAVTDPADSPGGSQAATDSFSE